MEENIIRNLTLQQYTASNAIAYNKNFVSDSSDYNYNILERAYQETGKIYAKLKMAIKSKKCNDPTCYAENKMLQQLNSAPQVTREFLETLMGELGVTENIDYDVNQNYEYMVANSIMKSKAGFSINDGYMVTLNLLEDGSQEIIFEGPLFKKPLIINSSALQSMKQSNTDLIAATPKINELMQSLLTKVGLFAQKDIVEGELSPQARISEDFVMKNPDGSYDYEIVDIGGGKGRNMLKFDMDKIQRKANPFINAEVAGMLQQEQETVAAWNVYIAQGTSVDEDDQMAQPANAGSKAWSYEEELPLSQENKILFETKYKEYFMKNYLKPFLTNQFPTVKEDAAVFDLAEARNAAVEKFERDNNIEI